MNLPPPPLLLHSPCPASIRHATGFQIDSVSYNNQIRDESLGGLPREGAEEKEGVGTVCLTERRMDCTEMGSLSQTPLGRCTASNKGKLENTSLCLFEPSGLLLPPQPRLANQTKTFHWTGKSWRGTISGPVAQTVKNPPAYSRPRFSPWLGRSPGEGNGSPLQYSCLENSMDGGA